MGKCTLSVLLVNFACFIHKDEQQEIFSLKKLFVLFLLKGHPKHERVSSARRLPGARHSNSREIQRGQSAQRHRPDHAEPTRSIRAEYRQCLPAAGERTTRWPELRGNRMGYCGVFNSRSSSLFDRHSLCFRSDQISSLIV